MGMLRFSELADRNIKAQALYYVNGVVLNVGYS